MKRIIISGGSGGLGKELARALSIAGHTVVILSPHEEKLSEAAEEIGCLYRVCDITDWQQVESAISSITTELDGLDVLINNAAVGDKGKIEDMNPDIIARTFNVNTVGALYLIKAVVPYMKQQRDGYIININSQAGLYAKAEYALYTGSKWGLTGVTRALQTELSAFGIKVTGLYPGALEQSMARDGKKEERDNSIAYQEVIDGVAFVLQRDKHTVIPELGLRHLDNVPYNAPYPAT